MGTIYKDRRAEVLRLLREQELSVENTNLQIDGIDFWPIVKDWYARYYINQEELFSTHKPIKPKRRRSSIEIRKDLLRKAIELWRFTHLRKNKVLVSSSSNWYSFREGKLFNRLTKLFENSLGRADHLIGTQDDWVKIKNGFHLHNLFEAFAWLQQKGLIEPSKHYEGYLSLSLLPEKAENTLNKALIRRVIRWRDFWHWVLKYRRPQVVLLTCYYSLNQYGLLAAAESLGIPTVEIQHGFIGANHQAYDGWNPGTRRYNTKPRFFWAWTAQDAQNLRNQNFLPHENIQAGGHPVLRVHREELSSIRNEKGELPSILFTAQPLDPIFPDHLVEAINQTTGKFQWLIRSHPRVQMNSGELQDYLSNHGLNPEAVDSIKIIEPAEETIFHSLARCDVHVTMYSSVVLEASMLKIPSVVLDSRVDFSSYDVEGKLIHEQTSRDPGELVQTIENLSTIPVTPRERPGDLPDVHEIFHKWGIEI